MVNCQWDNSPPETMTQIFFGYYQWFFALNSLEADCVMIVILVLDTWFVLIVIGFELASSNWQYSKIFVSYFILCVVSIWWVIPFRLSFIVCSYAVLLHHCPKLIWGLPSNRHLYVPVPSQEPAFQWFSFVAVYHYCLVIAYFFLHKSGC